MAVLPAHQRVGVGSALMEWAHTHAKALGLGEVRLGVRTQLPGNLAFYKRLGYEVMASHRHPGRRRVTWQEMRLVIK